jgi:hypothetical protein
MLPLPPLSATRLRELAEAADGLRGVPLKLAFVDGDYRIVDANARTADDRTIPVATASTKDPDSVKVEDIAITPAPKIAPDASGNTKVSQVFDALFWSESAVEKFLIPYYARLKDTRFLDQLRRDFRDKSVYMIGHLPWTAPVPLEPDESLWVMAPKATQESGLPAFMPLGEWRETRGRLGAAETP